MIEKKNLRELNIYFCHVFEFIKIFFKILLYFIRYYRKIILLFMKVFICFKEMVFSVRNVRKLTKFVSYKGNVKFDEIYYVFE